MDAIHAHMDALVRCAWDRREYVRVLGRGDLPGYWRCRYMDGGTVLIHGDYLEPMDASACADCVEVHGDNAAEWLARWPKGAEWREEHGAHLCDGCAEERTIDLDESVLEDLYA